MSTAQNLNYAVVQVVHNLGAVAVVSGSVGAMKLRVDLGRRKLALLVLGGWLTQAVSGATFGVVSYYYYRQLPDISGIAALALSIKIACATSGVLLLTTYLALSDKWTESGKSKAWLASCGLALTALCAAAFLRWFS